MRGGWWGGGEGVKEVELNQSFSRLRFLRWGGELACPLLDGSSILSGRVDVEILEEEGGRWSSGRYSWDA